MRKVFATGLAEEQFHRTLFATAAYEIRDGELWLYTFDDTSSALAFR